VCSSYVPMGRATQIDSMESSGDDNRLVEEAGLRRDGVRSQVIDALEAQEIKKTGNEEAYHQRHERNGQTTEADDWLDLGDRSSHYCVLDSVLSMNAIEN
jgi:hypothetical protein